MSLEAHWLAEKEMSLYGYSFFSFARLLVVLNLITCKKGSKHRLFCFPFHLDCN